MTALLLLALLPHTDFLLSGSMLDATVSEFTGTISLSALGAVVSFLPTTNEYTNEFNIANMNFSTSSFLVNTTTFTLPDNATGVKAVMSTNISSTSLTIEMNVMKSAGACFANYFAIYTIHLTRPMICDLTTPEPCTIPNILLKLNITAISSAFSTGDGSPPPLPGVVKDLVLETISQQCANISNVTNVPLDEWWFSDLSKADVNGTAFNVSVTQPSDLEYAVFIPFNATIPSLDYSFLIRYDSPDPGGVWVPPLPVPIIVGVLSLTYALYGTQDVSCVPEFAQSLLIECGSDCDILSTDTSIIDSTVMFVFIDLVAPLTTLVASLNQTQLLDLINTAYLVSGSNTVITTVEVWAIWRTPPQVPPGPDPIIISPSASPSFVSVDPIFGNVNGNEDGDDGDGDGYGHTHSEKKKKRKRLSTLYTVCLVLGSAVVVIGTWFGTQLLKRFLQRQDNASIVV
eukprot:c17714_g1_i1.p1 GENE.c17714_g1_i1~~c17714_g1_i1.p1  ORF type:complete len:458 (-),score=89.13 c17714_g1_i1:93-1466(-)